MMKRFLSGLLVLMLVTFSLFADSWVFPKEISKQVKEFGNTKIELTKDARKNQGWPMFELVIYDKDKMLSKYRNVAFEEIFASKDNQYFLGVSNSGIPGTAFVIFDNKGRLIREVKHDYSDLNYSSESVTIIKAWYDKKNPNVTFKAEKFGLWEVHINTSSGERINLLKKNGHL